MTTLLIPDNTVLVMFARIDRMDLLRQLVGVNGAWCGSVAYECDLSARVPGLSSIREAHEIFGEPMLPQTVQEHVDTQAIRVSFARPGETNSKHLGEAETISIIRNRHLRAAFVADDAAAAVRAARERIPT